MRQEKEEEEIDRAGARGEDGRDRTNENREIKRVEREVMAGQLFEHQWMEAEKGDDEKGRKKIGSTERKR